jgi:hypothetical protein
MGREIAEYDERLHVRDIVQERAPRSLVIEAMIGSAFWDEAQHRDCSCLLGKQAIAQIHQDDLVATTGQEL